MIKMKPIFLVCVGLVFLNPVFAQEKLELTKKDSIISSSWMFGVGINIVDDSGDVFDQLLKVDSLQRPECLAEVLVIRSHPVR